MTTPDGTAPGGATRGRLPVAGAVLYLVPVPLGDAPLDACIPGEVRALCERLDYVVAESARTARRVLKRFGVQRPMREIEIRELNEHTRAADVPGLLAPLVAGRSGALMSEAGCPGVADPGALLVAAAHQAGIVVRPLVGPSALLLALMGSGMNGQRFAFAGYLPPRPQERSGALTELETRSARDDETQIFIETPYRSQAMLEAAVATLRPDTRLAVGCDLTLPTERMLSRCVDQWRRQPVHIGKAPAVFLLQAAPAGAARRPRTTPVQ